MPVPPEPATSTVDLDVDQRVALLRTVASAVIDLADIGNLATFTLPYPSEAQRALDRVILTCLRRGATPPQSVVELVRWCRERAILDWPMELPEDVFAPADRLIDPESGQPTQLCQELAVRGRDSAVEQYDNAVMRAAMNLCQQVGSTKSYEAFRRLLIEKPVLTTSQFFAEAGELSLDPVRDLIEQIYEPVPVGYLSAGSYGTCARCKTLLTPLIDGRWWCERDVCRRQGGTALGTELRVDQVGELRHLARPLCQFVTWPGRAEIDLERRLLALGPGDGAARRPVPGSELATNRALRIQMWPDFDAYDLRITFPDDHVWAIDVKDWANPALLGRRARGLRGTPTFDEAFLVVPKHRLDIRRDYLDVFYRHRSQEAAGLQLVTDVDLVRKVQQRLTVMRMTGTEGRTCDA
jgi:hypothetical protein